MIDSFYYEVFGIVEAHGVIHEGFMMMLIVMDVHVLMIRDHDVFGDNIDKDNLDGIVMI